MGVAATWLPPELTTVQPYVMNFLLGCDTDRSRPCANRLLPFMVPAMGSSARIDAADMFIRAAFVAPGSIQNRARKAGETAIIMQYPNGLLEKLGLVEPPPSVAERVDSLMTPHDRIAAAEAVAQSFVEALAALEDED